MSDTTTAGDIYQGTSPLAEGEIRCLRVLPGSGDLVECQLRKRKIIPDLPELRLFDYNALSYEWGSPLNPIVIIVNGYETRIWRNLWLALKRLRRTDLVAYPVWVDSLCINQNDISERSSQVSIMGQIYTHAFKVISWLGEASDDSAWLFNFLHNNPFPWDLPRSESSDGTTIAPEKLATQRKREDRAFLGLCKLLNRSYWKRVWIIQEIVAASSLTFVCGSGVLLWEELQNSLNNYGSTRLKRRRTLFDTSYWETL